MIRNVEFLKVQNIGFAIVPEEPAIKDDGSTMDFYSAYFINLKDELLENVFIRSKGSGMVKDEKVETSVLRVLFEKIGPKSFVKVDGFDREALNLSNEYWISFKENGYLFDKKYVFVPGSIESQNFTEIPLLGKRGVLIK